ncbi:MAG: TVP38/TMEM64 family protein [Syntrophales bacterium]|nr:TVP38/TMEM64 family protein [Syntrophales bacterium]
MKRFLFFVALAAVIVTVGFSGIARRLEPEAIRTWIQGYGALAPLVYMLVYTIAPVLLLPGLPLTIAGGILFGPFWGVVYAIAGSTLGACVAFLAARYIARDWVERRLQDPRWRRLDRAVEEQGWKIVAFTRLIPLFPFNLLNYAFGLTRIRFLHYALATFVFMLPACIAFIVFSSSLPDLIQGRLSPSFLAGLGMVLLVSLIPVLYRRYRNKKGMKDPL